jgi:hypothetical protein
VKRRAKTHDCRPLTSTTSNVFTHTITNPGFAWILNESNLLPAPQVASSSLPNSQMKHETKAEGDCSREKAPSLASQTHLKRDHKTKAERNESLKSRGRRKRYQTDGLGTCSAHLEAGRGTLSLRSVVPNTRKKIMMEMAPLLPFRRSIDAPAPYRACTVI